MPRETIKTGNHVGLIESLPKWAANEIHRLDAEVKDLRRKLDATLWDVDNNEIVVPTGVRVRSSLPCASYDRLYLDFEANGTLNVSVMGLQVRPEASNRVNISQRSDR